MSLNSSIVQIMNQQPAGTYLIEQDQSAVPSIQTQSGLRLLIGQSRKGVVNKPMYIDSWLTFKSYWGDIDRTLERKGSFFHRFAEYMLLAGPILAMNIRPFDNELDLAGLTELSTKASIQNANVKTKPFADCFNTQRFWFLDQNQIVDSTNTDQPLNIVNIGHSKKSIFIRKSKIGGYNLTVEDWYAMQGKEKPGYLFSKDQLSDYMIDVYVFDNDFLNAESNPNYGHLFNKNGVQVTVVDSLGETQDGLEQLRSIQASNFVEKFEGCLIPGFIGSTGKSIAIDTVINRKFETVGLMAAFNMSIFDAAATWEPQVDENDVIVTANDGAKQQLPVDLIGQSSFSFDAESALVTEDYESASTKMLSYAFDNKIDVIDDNVFDLTVEPGATMINFDNVMFPLHYQVAGSNHVYSIASKLECYKISEVPVLVGDKFVGEDGNIARVVDNKFIDYLYTLDNGIHTRDLPLQADGTPFTRDTDGVFVYPPNHAQAGLPVEFESADLDSAPLSAPSANDGVAIAMPVLSDSAYVNLLKSFGNLRILYKLKFDSPIYISGETTVTSAVPVYERKHVKKSDSSVWNDYFANANGTYKLVDFDKVVTEYAPIKLSAYKPRNEQFCDGTSARQNTILNVVTGDLRNAMKDKEAYQFSYIVDSFKTYIESGIKEQFSAITAERQMNTYIGSGPSVTDLINSVDPYFKQTITGKFDFEQLRTGGNTSLPHSKLFAMPVLGASYAGYFIGNFIIDDNGQEISLPPSGIVSNAFVNKRNTGQVYEIASGSARGAISAPGVKRIEYAFTDQDRKVCESVGLNTIISKRNTGLQIKGNTTAYVKVKSALSLLHVRELLNELETMIRSVLERYDDDFNTPQNRLLIKTQADNICRNYAAGGALSYFQNIMNENNNDGDVLDNELGLIDTIIIPNKGMKQLIHRVTISSNAGIKTSVTE